MQIVPDQPSVLFVKTTHVNALLQTIAIQVRAGFCPLHVYSARVDLNQDVGESAAREFPPVASR